MRFYVQLAFTLLVCAFLVIPVVTSILAGVTENFFVGVKSGLTLRWIGEVWELYARTVYLSIGVALACLAATLVLGVPAAYVLARAQNRWTRAFEELLVLPVAVPGLATALALILFYGQIREFRASWTFILVGHVLFTLPFMVRSVLAVMAAAEKLDPKLEEAARSLGASPWRVVVDVLIPGLKPALISAGAICFATAMGAFGTAFTLATRINVLPITIYTEFTNYANFAIAAALSIVLGVLTWLVLNLARTFAGSTVAAAA